MIGKDVYLYDIHSIILSNGKFVFVNNDGKLKAIPQKEIFAGKDGVELACKEIVNIKNKSYIRCSYSNTDYYFLINPKKDSYVGKFRNLSYWHEYFNNNKPSHAYLYTKEYFAEKLTDQFDQIEWIGPNIPTNSIDEEVFFIGNTQKSKQRLNIRYSDFDDVTTGTEFKSQNDYDIANAEQMRLDSIQEAKDQVQDKIPLPAVCIKEYTYGKEDYEHTNEGDTAYVYMADTYNLYMYYQGSIIKTDYTYFEPTDKAQLAFIKSRGEKNLAVRSELAETLSNEWFNREIERVSKRLETTLAIIDAHEKEISRKQLFLKEMDYEYGEFGDFGMSFRIYNCFKKTIKYIEFTCTPYNSVGDIQADWVGKRISRSKGIGPLEPGESATWSWNDLFYDKNDIIEKVRLTAIKFIFKDGSTLNFSGWQNIQKHSF